MTSGVNNVGSGVQGPERRGEQVASKGQESTGAPPAGISSSASTLASATESAKATPGRLSRLGSAVGGVVSAVFRVFVGVVWFIPSKFIQLGQFLRSSLAGNADKAAAAKAAEVQAEARRTGAAEVQGFRGANIKDAEARAAEAQATAARAAEDQAAKDQAANDQAANDKALVEGVGGPKRQKRGKK